MKKLVPADFVAMDDYLDEYPLRLHLAYAYDSPPNIFGIIYKKSAQLWLWKPLAQTVLHASEYLHDTTGLYLKLYDGLRTIEAQQKMMDTEIVQNNTHWLEEPRLLSTPGQGAHPRGMAIDCEIVHDNGDRLDMGTVFDHFAEQTDEQHNPAHRDYIHLTDTIRANRDLLDTAMRKGASKAGIKLHLLSTEWWDFRLPAEICDAYAPLSDKDLPAEMQMVGNKTP